MTYIFTSITKEKGFIKLGTAEGDSVRIPEDKFLTVTDNSQLVSIKTVGSRATIGTISEAIYEYEFKPAGEKEVVLLLQNGTVERNTYNNGIIPNSAFSRRTDIVSAKIGEGITEIGNTSFYNSNSIESVTIPRSVRKIGYRAFGGCVNIKAVNISDLDAWLNIDFVITLNYNSAYDGNPAFYSKKILVNGEEVTSLSINNTTIGYGASNMSAVTSVSISNNTTTINDYAFSKCRGITSINFPDSVTTINGYVLKDCSSLSAITIGSGITFIGYWFTESKRNCDLTIYATTPPTITSRTFYGTSGKIYVPSESVETYKAAKYWSADSSRIQAIP